MDGRVNLFIFIVFLFVINAHGKVGDLKICVVGNPKLKSTRTTKYCDLLAKSKRTPVSCVYAVDRLECLLAVSRRKADFSVFEAEDLYFSTLWDESSILVVSEIKALKKKAFQYGIVAMVRKNSNITSLGDLRGSRLCHPGTEAGPEWNYLFAQYFEDRVAPADCDEDLSIYEDRIKTTSNFFGSACKAGPWVLDEEEDARLKNKYWNLCSLCEESDCGNGEKYRGSGGSLICFKDGVGDILWARHEDVKAHFKFLESGSTDPIAEFAYLCDDGSLMPLSSEEPCYWLAKPWQIVGANRKSATDVQKVVDALSDDDRAEWEDNLLHILELYLEYIRNVMVSRTPEDYLRRIPGYLSASAMSQGNCKPRHSVILCVTSSIEEQKCDWISKASSALGIQPSILCTRKPNMTACLDSVAKKETDIVSVPADFYYDAATKYKLKSILLETGTHFNDSYLSSVIVKKKSGMKKLSDLRGKRICLTRKHGVGWWTVLSALHQESLIGSPCQGFSGYFEQVCVMERNNGKESDALETCCSNGVADGESTNILRCLHDDGCDVAVVDYNTFNDADGSFPSKILGASDFRSICSSEKTTDCHWMWSYPNYLMIHSETLIPKREEIYGAFFQLGQYFGRNSRKNNPMLEIFGPFHQVNNVLFKDTSASFIPSDKWNRSGSYLDAMKLLKACSKSATKQLSSITLWLGLLVFLDGFS